MSKLAGAKMELRCGKALKLCLFLRLPICWMCCFALVPAFVSFTAQWDKIVKCCEKQFATDTSYYHIRKAVSGVSLCLVAAFVSGKTWFMWTLVLEREARLQDGPACLFRFCCCHGLWWVLSMFVLWRHKLVLLSGQSLCLKMNWGRGWGVGVKETVTDSS